MKNQVSQERLLFIHIGKLMYAISASDNIIREEEFEILKTILKEEWHPQSIEEFDTIILEIFENAMKNKHNADQSFQEFLTFRSNNKYLFTIEITDLIFNTARLIASSYASKNKSELIMLAKLNMALNA